MAPNTMPCTKYFWNEGKDDDQDADADDHGGHPRVGEDHIHPRNCIVHHHHRTERQLNGELSVIRQVEQGRGKLIPSTDDLEETPARPGLLVGKYTRVKMAKSPAPSIRAASASDVGTVRK